MVTTLSDKFRVASFVAAVLVVLRHAHNLPAFFPMATEPAWLNGLEWGTVFWTDVAVPFFFFSSGFFFMRTDYVREKKYLSMLGKKASSLLIPFVLWNLVGLCFLFVSDKEGNMGDIWSQMFQNFLLSKWYGPLWFVRDLMLLMLFYPLYGWLYRKPFQPLLVALILWLMYSRWWPADISLLTAEGIIFFLLGGLFQQHSTWLTKKLPAYVTLFLLVSWLLYSFFVTTWNMRIHQLSLLIGMPAFWFSLDLLPQRVREFCRHMSKYSFLIYVTHFYLLKVMKVGTAHFFVDNAGMAFIAFLVIPIVLISMIIAIGRTWERLSPQTYSFCMGGRRSM